MWGDCDVVRPGGEWRGWRQFLLTEPCRLIMECSYCMPLSLAATFSSPQEVCHQYWPDGSTKGVQKYGEYSVSVLQTTEQDGFIERVISITNPKVVA